MGKEVDYQKKICEELMRIRRALEIGVGFFVGFTIGWILF